MYFNVYFIADRWLTEECILIKEILLFIRDYVVNLLMPQTQSECFSNQSKFIIITK